MGWENDLNKRAKVIIRRSGMGQESNTSATTQTMANDRYIKERGLEKVGEDVVITETAWKSENRKQYKTIMRESIKEGIKHFVFYTSSRETRNHIDAAWIETLCREGKIIVHHVSDNRVFWKGTPDEDWFIRDM